MAIKDIITAGFGTFSYVNQIPTRGFTAGEYVMTPSALPLVWSASTPATSLILPVSPGSVTWSGVAPVTALLPGVAPLSATWSAVAPSLSMSLGVSPTSADWSAVVPGIGLSIITIPTPAQLTWSIVEPTLSYTTTVLMDPVSVLWSATTADTRVGRILSGVKDIYRSETFDAHNFANWTWRGRVSASVGYEPMFGTGIGQSYVYMIRALRCKVIETKIGDAEVIEGELI